MAEESKTIVQRLADAQASIATLTAERDALNWALMRGSRSRRVAWQFAKDWAGSHKPAAKAKTKKPA